VLSHESNLSVYLFIYLCTFVCEFVCMSVYIFIRGTTIFIGALNVQCVLRCTILSQCCMMLDWIAFPLGHYAVT
jgi:hypothetical protein